MNGLLIIVIILLGEGGIEIAFFGGLGLLTLFLVALLETGLLYTSRILRAGDDQPAHLGCMSRSDLPGPLHSKLADDFVPEQLLEQLGIYALYEVLVMFQHQLHFAVALSARLDEVADTIRDRRL